MDRQTKQNWIAALKSGEYKQTQFTLKTENNEYCAIGVLCELTNTPFIQKELMAKGILSDDERMIVVRLNDANHASFDEIADWIEVNL